LPASADPAPRGRRSIDDCTRFDQRDAGDDAVELSIDSTCPIPLQCRIAWRLTCAPETRRRRSTPASVSLRLDAGASVTRTASAAACGGDGWMIDRVVWSCAPSPARGGA
jgi:hypothetical protein